MQYQVLFSLKKKNEKVFMNVVCCSRDWRCKSKYCDRTCTIYHVKVSLGIYLMEAAYLIQHKISSYLLQVSKNNFIIESIESVYL